MQSNKWRQYSVSVLSFVYFSELLVLNQLSNPKAFRLSAGSCPVSGQYAKLCLHCTRRVCFFGVIFHTRHGDLSFEQETLEENRTSVGSNTAKCTRLCCWTWCKILGNAAVSKFTFCIQGLALCPFFCSVLRGVKAIYAYLTNSSEKVNKTICRAYLLSYRFVRLLVWKQWTWQFAHFLMVSLHASTLWSNIKKKEGRKHFTAVKPQYFWLNDLNDLQR